MRLDDRPVIDQITEPSIENIIDRALYVLDGEPLPADLLTGSQTEQLDAVADWAGNLIADYIIERLAQ